MGQLTDNSGENGIVSPVALAVGPAAQDTVSLGLTCLTAEDLCVDVPLLFDHDRQGEVGTGLFVQGVGHGFPFLTVLCKEQHVLP